MFQHTAARRRLVTDKAFIEAYLLVSTHSRPKAAGAVVTDALNIMDVSTHSRPKAAGGTAPVGLTGDIRFNTQPPEGGWRYSIMLDKALAVSTHSRPKAAGR